VSGEIITFLFLRTLADSGLSEVEPSGSFSFSKSSKITSRDVINPGFTFCSCRCCCRCCCGVVVLGGEAGGAGKGEQGVAAVVVAVVVAVGEPVGVVGPRELGGEAQLHVGVDAGRVAGGEDGGGRGGGWGRGGGEQGGGQRGVGEGGREAGGRTLLQCQRVQQVVGHLC